MLLFADHLYLEFRLTKGSFCDLAQIFHDVENVVGDVRDSDGVQSLDVHGLVSFEMLKVFEEIGRTDVVGAFLVSPDLPYHAWFFSNALRQPLHAFLHRGIRRPIDSQVDVPNFLCAHS